MLEDNYYDKKLSEIKIFPTNTEKELSKDSNVQSKTWDDLYNFSINPETREKFFLEMAKDVHWDSFPTKVLDRSNPPFFRWFPDGLTNACYNCIDRHIEQKRGDRTALIAHSCYTKNNFEITYKQLLENVCRMADIFIRRGVKKGDTIIIYMPMILEAIYAMLACARIGAIHSVVFGGFAADELADRIIDCNPSLIVTASCGIERTKVLMYYPTVVHALEIAKGKKSKVYSPFILMVQREDVAIEKNFKEEYKNLDYQLELKGTRSFIDYEKVESNHPLYILYTSGTTGVPKGIVRDTGGTITVLNWELANVMDIDHTDVYFSSSDIGWVVGHSFIVYGPLIRGAATVIFEGKPVSTPHPAVFWEVVEKYKVKALYTAPTALRAIKREDFDYKEMRKFNTSSLKSIHMAGERCDPETVTWISEGLGGKVLINDNWWQTESGWSICSNNIRIHQFPTEPGSTTKPLPGFEVIIYDTDENKEIHERNKLGMVYIKLPMPPSFMLTLWNNDDFFKEKYISKDNKYYKTGDAGFFDMNGYFHIMTRTDDLINIAGHRLSTGRMEEVLIRVDEVVEAAVVSVEDDLKGLLPVAFVVLKQDVKSPDEDIIKKCHKRIVEDIGAIARLKDCYIVARLPKTRSGKILRGIMRHICNNEGYRYPSTIEDATVLDEIKKIVGYKRD